MKMVAKSKRSRWPRRPSGKRPDKGYQGLGRPGPKMPGFQIPDTPPTGVRDPNATPLRMHNGLHDLHALSGNKGHRNDREQQYYRFHKSHGLHLRAKYRPEAER